MGLDWGKTASFGWWMMHWRELVDRGWGLDLADPAFCCCFLDSDLRREMCERELTVEIFSFLAFFFGSFLRKKNGGKERIKESS